MGVRLPAWLRVLRRRPGAFVGLLLLSAAAVLVSAVTPMMLSAVNAVALRDGVADARFPANGAAVTVQAQDARALSGAADVSRRVLTAVGRRSDRWGAVRAVVETRVRNRYERVDGGGPVRTALLSVVPDGCTGVVLVEGRCPRGAGEAALPASLAADLRWSTGIELTGGLRIVGVFDDASQDGALLADPARLLGARDGRAVPNPIVARASVPSLDGGFQITAARALVRPIRDGDLPAIRRGLAAASRVAATPRGAAVEAAVTSGIPQLTAGIRRTQQAATVLAAPIGASALVLAWAALFHVARRTARARSPEWGIDRTRGAPPLAWLASIGVEPIVAVLLGALVGYAAAVPAAALVSAAVLGTPAPVAATGALALAAGALALAGCLGGLVAASVQSALLPLDRLLRDTVEPRRSSRGAFAARIAVLTLTATVIGVSLTAPPSSGPQLVLVLPVLLALTVGLLGRLAGLLLVRRTSRRAPRRLSSLVVGRTLVRAPSALAGAQLVLIATASAVFVVQVQHASTVEQTDRAELATGAAQVLTVAVPDGVSLLDAVRRADPGGRTAMAAREVGDADDASTAHVVAVDVARLDAVADWRAAWRGSSDLTRLRADVGEELVLRGERITMRLDDVRDGPRYPRPAESVRLTAVLAAEAGWQRVELGDVRDGTLIADIPCSGGCRLVALQQRAVGGSTNTPWGVSFTVRGLATDQQPPPALDGWLRAGRWRERLVDGKDPRRPARTAVVREDGGFRVESSDQEGDLVAALEPAVGPAVVPAVFATATRTSAFAGVAGSVLGSALSNEVVLMRSAGRAPALPRTLRGGALVDLAALERVTDPAAATATSEVWMTAGPHPQVLAGLQEDGIRVVGRASAAGAVASALRGPTDRALAVVGATAAGGILVALVGVLVGVVVEAPLRRREHRALRSAGVAPRTVRRLVALRLAIPAAAAVLLGLGTGLLAGAITLPRMPLLVGLSAGPPPDLTPPLAPVIVLTAALLLAVTVVGVVGGRLEVPERAR